MKVDLIKHQPRERAVPCPNHSRRHPVMTWNVSGRCDACERGRRVALTAEQRDGAAYDRGRYYGVIL